jgi:uncharacterized protein (TIGR02271 family)
MMSWSIQADETMTESEVYGSDGDKVGTVAAAYPGYIVVEKGFFFPTDYYVPRSAIGSVDSDQIYLTVTKDAALHSGWNAKPVDLETATTATTAGSLSESNEMAAQRIESEGEIHIPVFEEELIATVRPRQTGTVHIEKDVVTEEQTLDVPLTEEQVRVERRVIDRPATEADTGAFEDMVMEVPLRTETVDVQKEPRVTEEVVISKEAVQRTEQVSGTVLHEEVFIDEEGAVNAARVEEGAGTASSAV